MSARRALTLLLIVAGLAACGASAREKSLKATLVTVNAARDGFIAYDEAKQDAIIEHATSLEAGTVALTKYRADVQTPIVGLFIATYRAIAEAFAAKADEASFNKVTAAAKELHSKLDEAMKGAP